MKKIKLLIAFACIGALTFYACKKDSDDTTTTPTTATCSDGIKNQNETDIDCGGVCPACAPAAMTCLVDGVSWAAAAPNVSITTSTRMVGIQTAGSTVSRISIALQGTIVLNTAYSLTASNVIEKVYLTTTGTTTTTCNANAGTIKFTRLDTVNGKASGTFSGTFVSTIGGTITKQITAGIFTNLPIQ